MLKFTDGWRGDERCVDFKPWSPWPSVASSWPAARSASPPSSSCQPEKRDFNNVPNHTKNPRSRIIVFPVWLQNRLISGEY